MSNEIKRDRIVQYTGATGEARSECGVVKWVGKDGRGELHAVVRWDSSGTLLLTPVRHLRIATLCERADG